MSHPRALASMVVLVGALLAPAGASAESITVGFSGTETVNGVPFEASTFTGSFTYDPDAIALLVDQGTDDDLYVFSAGVLSLSWANALDFTGAYAQSDAKGVVEIALVRGAAGDYEQLLFTADMNGPGERTYFVELILRNDPARVVAGTNRTTLTPREATGPDGEQTVHLPSLPAFASFDSAEIRLRETGGPDPDLPYGSTIDGRIDAAVVVPEPGLLALAALGVVGAGRRSRRARA